MMVFHGDTKSLLGLLIAKMSSLSSQSLSLQGISSSLQSMHPSPVFVLVSSELLLFLSFFSFLKDQQQNDLYCSHNGESSAPFSGKILSPHKLAAHTQCPSPTQGSGSSCYAACFIGPSYLLARCYFLRCDTPFCRSEPYSFALGMKLKLQKNQVNLWNTSSNSMKKI